MSERTFIQEFVERFRSEAPDYPQPETDYYPMNMHLTFDVAWPERKVAVELSLKPSVIHLTDWKVLTLSPYGKAHLSDVIQDVKAALDV